MMIDPCLYPDSDVLQNRLGIRTAAGLDHLIDSATDQALRALPSLPRCTSGDALALLHKALLASVFDWAGRFRTTALGYDGHDFARSDLIIASLDAAFDALLRRDDAKDSDRARFFDTLAHHISELYAISPFRAGNEAVLKVHAAQLAYSSVWDVDWTPLTSRIWHELLAQTFVSLDHKPLALALQGQLSSVVGPKLAQRGVAGLALPPMRDPPTGKHYLTSIKKLATLLLENYEAAKQEAIDNICRLEREAGDDAALNFARQELAFLVDAKGPLFQLEILRALDVAKIRVLIDPAHSALEIIREVAAAIVIALHSQPQPLIEQLALSHSALACPPGVSPHNERMALTFLRNSAAVNRADPRFAALQNELDVLGVSESVIGGINAKQLAERTSQARLGAAARIRAGAITLSKRGP